eukprot:5889720-Pyramimonas_sp.AAC.1
MSDFRDILGLGSKGTEGQPQDAKLKKPDKQKKPEGVSRESASTILAHSGREISSPMAHTKLLYLAGLVATKLSTNQWA